MLAINDLRRLSQLSANVARDMQEKPFLSVLEAKLSLVVRQSDPAWSQQADVDAETGRADADARMLHYTEKVAKHPRLYPAYALLGSAYFDKARQTHDARDLAKAREALERSLEIQVNFEALKTMAAVSNFSHRFQEAIMWIQRAADAYPEDSSLTAMLVEAYLALGQVEAARQCLTVEAAGQTDFYINAAMGNLMSAENQPNEAVEKFLQAARLAEAERVFELVQWAKVTAAGVYLDVGQYERAKPLLDASSKTNPADTFLRIHQAELAEASGQQQEALAIYQWVL